MSQSSCRDRHVEHERRRLTLIGTLRRTNPGAKKGATRPLPVLLPRLQAIE